MRLPGYQANALLDFTPVQGVLDRVDQRNERDRRYDLEQQQMGMQQERLGMDRQRFAEDRENQIKKRIGNLALLTLQEADEAKRAEKWKNVIALNPDAAKLGPQYADHRTGPLSLLADAGMAGDYLSYQMRQQESARAAAAERERLRLAQSQDARAAALHPHQVSSARVGAEAEDLRLRAARAELDAPKLGKLELKPGESAVFYDPKTGETRRRIDGGPKPPDATDRKAAWEVQDQIPLLRTTIEQLEEAQRLVPDAYHGYLAQTRSAHNQASPEKLPNVLSSPSNAAATVRLNQLMSEQAIAAMAAALKGATTDREMDQFKAMMASPSTRPDQKLAVINDLLTRARRQYQVGTTRLKELGANVPEFGQPQGGGGAGAGVTGNDPLGIRR